MITREELERVAKLKGLTLENCEKDYFQDIVLLTIYKEVRREFVFKGGTCLYKVYKLNRFSEDLDFTISKKAKADKILQSILYSVKSLNIGVIVKDYSQFQKQVNIRLAFRGPLYKGNKESMLMILLNLSSREKQVLEPRKELIVPMYSDLPTFEVYAMDENEIVIEKIITIMERNKPRDVYDLWFLLKVKGLKVDTRLLSNKFGELDLNDFMKKVDEKTEGWERELGRFVIGSLPPFSQVKKEIKEKMEGIK